MKRNLLCSVFAVLLAAHTTIAQTPARLIEEASGAFAALDFERALGLLERALQAKGNSPGDLVRIYTLRGMCYVSLGRNELAGKSFRAALSIDPAFRLSPDVSPRFQEPFRQVLEAGAPPLALRIEFPPWLEWERPWSGNAELISDPEELSALLYVFYRLAGERKYGSLELTVPVGQVKSFQLVPGGAGENRAEFLEWYAVLQDRYGNRLFLRGDEEHPLRVPLRRREAETAAAAPTTAQPVVAPQPWYAKWWVWAIVGTAAAAAGGAALGVLLSTPPAGDRDFSIVVR